MPIRPVPTPPHNPTADQLDLYFKDLKQYAEEVKIEAEKLEEEKAQQEAAAKLKRDQLKAQEELLETNQTSIDEQMRELRLQRSELQIKTDDLRSLEREVDDRGTELARREADAEVRIRNADKREEHFKSEAQKLTEREKQLKADEARIETLKRDLPVPAPGGAAGGFDAAIILQQKQILEKCLSQNEKTEVLLARQLRLEEDRERREKERDRKEEESLATGKGFKPPSFKGQKGERPEAHLLRAEDWMEASNPKMRDDQKIKNFRLTLDHHAREWYDKADCKGTWEKLKLGFSRHFSTQGRSIMNLLTRWKSFRFNPEVDDIEEFVRDVQETASQLKYDEEAIGMMIKTCMPHHMYANLYEVTDLEKIITKVRDIYAKPVHQSQAEATASAAAVPSATPFSSMTEQYMYLQGANGDNKQKPFKPYVTPQGRGRGRGRGGRGRGKGRGRGASQDTRFQGVGRGQFSFRGSWQPRGNRGRGGQGYDKSPNVKKPRVNAKTPNIDRNRCNYCKEHGHWVKDCPQKQQNNNQGNNGPAQQKTFPGATYNYMYPMVPQVPMAPVAMPSNGVQVPMQGNNTAALGQMQDVMMQLNEVKQQDNPIFMELTEEEKKEEETYLN